jgi:hypothetical protein
MQLLSNIKRSVDIGSGGWGDAPWAEKYYAEAEKQTTFFWDAGVPFRQLFERLDLESVVELACGRGRHAGSLHRAERLVLMDIHEGNVDACRRRLCRHTHLEYRLISGRLSPAA